MRPAVVYGGANVSDQMRELDRYVDILKYFQTNLFNLVFFSFG